MREFEWLEPASIEEASAMLSEHDDDCRLMSGGTALMLALRQGMLTPTHIISLDKIDALRGISVDESGTLIVGARSLHSEIAKSPVVQNGWPVLAEMASVLANPQVRNQGSIGGNLCYGDPSTDPPVCLLAHDARVVLQNATRRRELSIGEFLVDYFETAIQPDEVLCELRIPPSTRQTGRHIRHRRTAAEHRPMINMCITVDQDGLQCRDIRIAVGATTPVPRRIEAAETLLRGTVVTADSVRQAADIVADKLDVLDDMRGDEAFRRHVTRVIARRNLAVLFDVEGVST